MQNALGILDKLRIVASTIHFHHISVLNFKIIIFARFMIFQLKLLEFERNVNSLGGNYLPSALLVR